MIGLCGCWARPSVFDGGECGSAGGSGPLQLTHNARHHLHPGCLGFLFLLYWPDFFPSSSRCAGRLSVEDVGAACEGGDRMGDPGPNFARRLPLHGAGFVRARASVAGATDTVEVRLAIPAVPPFFRFRSGGFGEDREWRWGSPQGRQRSMGIASRASWLPRPDGHEQRDTAGAPSQPHSAVDVLR